MTARFGGTLRGATWGSNLGKNGVRGEWQGEWEGGSWGHIFGKLGSHIGVRESGFQNIAEVGGGKGRGVFQIDLGAHRNVTEAQAFDVSWSANYAATLLRQNVAIFDKTIPDLNRPWSPYGTLAPALAAYNHGFRGTAWAAESGSLEALDNLTAHDNYVSSVLNLMDCFE